MRRHTVVLTCLCVFSLSIASSAYAFDYHEHKYLSNVGFRIALAASTSPCLPKDELMRFVAPSAIAKRYSFGDIVGLADYIHDVDTIFERPGALDPHVDSYNAFAWDYVATLKKDWPRFLQASHVNESHFQLNALLAHMNHHDSAILLARDGRIFRAVVIEAYGLHFLEDFHAPGHVATTRAVLPDYAAIAVHEKFNSAGMTFTLRPDAELAELASFTAGVFDLLAIQALAHDKVQEQLRLTPADFEALGSALGGAGQPFFGDSLLYRQKVQAAYVAILAARSVLDVLDAGCGAGRPEATIKSSFVPVCWYVGRPRSDAECAGRPIPRVPGYIKQASTPFGGFEPTRDNLYLFMFRPDNVLMFSCYNEFSGGGAVEGRTTRSEFVVESLLMSSVPSAFMDLGEGASEDLKRLQRVGWFASSVLYGVSGTFGDTNSIGAHVRLIFAIPRIDIQLSGSYGIRSYELRGERRLKAASASVFKEPTTDPPHFYTHLRTLCL